MPLLYHNLLDCGLCDAQSAGLGVAAHKLTICGTKRIEGLIVKKSKIPQETQKMCANQVAEEERVIKTKLAELNAYSAC